MESASMFIDRWMDKEVMVHVYSIILFSRKKKCIWLSSNEVDEAWAYYQSEVIQKEKDKCYILMHIYGI